MQNMFLKFTGILIIIWVLLSGCNKEYVNPYTSNYDLIGQWFIGEYNSRNYFYFNTNDYIRYNFKQYHDNGYISSGTYEYNVSTISFNYEQYIDLDTTLIKNFDVRYDNNKLELINDEEQLFLIPKQ